MVFLTILLWFISSIIGTAILRVFIYTEYKTDSSEEFITLFLGVLLGWLVIIAAILRFLLILSNKLLQAVTCILEDITNS